jgi:ubiquinone/menaquinone biosynthesis methyltransferase
MAPSKSPPILPHPESSDPKGDQVRQMFSRIAPTYDLLNRLLSFGVDQHWRTEAVRRITVPSPARVLDLCGGTGDVALKVIRRRPADSVVVADFAQPMLVKAAGRLAGCDTRHGVLCADALQLPFESESFDAAFCAFGVRNWSDIDQGLREVHRVLKPGGEFAVLDFLKAGRGLPDALGRFYIHKVLPTVGSWVSGDRRAYRYLAESMEGFCSEGEFREKAHAAGFAAACEKRFFLGLCWLFVLRKPNAGARIPSRASIIRKRFPESAKKCPRKVDWDNIPG